MQSILLYITTSILRRNSISSYVRIYKFYLIHYILVFDDFFTWNNVEMLHHFLLKSLTIRLLLLLVVLVRRRWCRWNVVLKWTKFEKCFEKKDSAFKSRKNKIQRKWGQEREFPEVRKYIPFMLLIISEMLFDTMVALLPVEQEHKHFVPRHMLQLLYHLNIENLPFMNYLYN